MWPRLLGCLIRAEWMSSRELSASRERKMRRGCGPSLRPLESRIIGSTMATTTARPRTVKGRFGPYGGRYVPETLMAALQELEAAYAEARKDKGFKQEFLKLLHDYAGRPTPLFFAQRLTEHLGGARIHLKREDLLHTGAHKINNCIGQALLAPPGKAPHHRRNRSRPARSGHSDRVRALRHGVRGVHGR